MWVLILILLRCQKLRFFEFIVGSVGIFLLMLFYANDVIEEQILKALGLMLGLIANYVSFLDVFAAYGMLTVKRSSEVVTFFLDYECTGILEILVFVSLVSFYPVRGLLGKLYHITIGVMYITVVNVIRVMVIVLTIYGFGMNYFFFAHTIIARIIFFVFVVSLYYQTFTKKHIELQKVGAH